MRKTPKRKKIEDLTPNYKKASKELILAYKRLGTVQNYFKEGRIGEARKLIGYVKHYVHDGLHFLRVKDEDLEEHVRKT